MSTTRRAATLAVVVLGLAACGRSASPPAGSALPTETADHARAGVGSPTAPTEPSPAPGAGEVALAVRVEGGRVVEVPAETVARVGDLVHLVVTADVRDEVHVHGYDLMAEVRPGSPAHLEFTASAPGLFEVELEEAGLLLFRLEVRP